ncbi:MAG: hypothetical protein BWY15_02435 [Firmicutes bacterium ADurb.Bin193]|nr:MAG: hypothetical protein BWY15_02435 [Firmicutes bacterium ADurb.Bin193]
MLTVMCEKMGGCYSRRLTVHEINSENLRRAQGIFDDYKSSGIILNNSFDDMAWRLSNQTQNVDLTLITFKGNYRKNAMEWIGCNCRCYLDCVKAYIAFNLGEISLPYLKSISETFISLAEKTGNEAISAGKHIKHIVGLLQIIPGSNEKRDYVIEALEEKMERQKWNLQKGNKRCLADFRTYLRFSEILDKFWRTADRKQKLFYFPLYFWWNLTAILPLRPMEFLMTPRDCLETNDNGNNILTVRRTKLKGGMKKVTYRIDGDYERKKYTIPEKLAEELRSYLIATKNMRRVEIGTLFSQEPHYNYFGISAKPSSWYYSYANLNTCLQNFYREVIGEERNETNCIRLGDTRHIAMVNLIISGGSPVICRELAGHSDIDISSHYFSNISNLVECVTLEKYRQLKGESAKIVGTQKYSLTVPESMYRLPDGWCDAPSVKEGDISECLKVSDEHGCIGSCSHCIHYWPDEQGIRLKFLDEQAGKQAIDADSRYLMCMIETVRKGLGHTEDIGSALLRLQRSSNHYGNCLWEKYMKADDESWQDLKS